MRILYVCSDFGIAPDGTKGASIHLRAITRALAQAGHRVQLLSPKPGPDGDHPAERLIEPGCQPIDDNAKMLKRWLLDRQLGDTAAREYRPLLYNAWVQERAVQAIGADVPDVVIERLSLFGHVGLDLAERLQRPLVVEVNALLTQEAQAYRSLEMRDLARRIERRVLQRADAITAVSSTLARRIAATGIPKCKIHVVPNGVDPSTFDAAPDRQPCRAELGIPQDAFVVGFIGSLKPWHGVTVLLDAFARLHDVDRSARLLIVGNGPMEVELKQTVQRYDLANAVTFTGAVEHRRIAAMIGAMDVATAPFIDLDPFYFSPIKIFEYMAGGTCIVASNQGQIAEIIQDGVTGLLCPPSDPQALFAKLDWVRKSPGRRQELADRAADVVRQTYTWTHAAQKTLAVVQGLTSSTQNDDPGVPSSDRPQFIEASS